MVVVTDVREYLLNRRLPITSDERRGNHRRRGLQLRRRPAGDAQQLLEYHSLAAANAAERGVHDHGIGRVPLEQQRNGGLPRT